MGGKFLETSRGIRATSYQTLKTSLVLARKMLDCQSQLIQAWQPAIRQLEQGVSNEELFRDRQLVGRSWKHSWQVMES